MARKASIGESAPLRTHACVSESGGAQLGAMMHVRDGRLLAVSPTPGATGASGASGLAPCFALAEADGTVLRRGRLPAELAAGILIVADYGLLDDPGILRLRVSRIGLVPPGDPASTAPRPVDAEAVLRAWTGEEPAARASIAASDLEALRLHLEARHDMVQLRARLLELIAARIAAVSPDYLSTVSPDGRIIAQTLPLLRKHPTPRMLDEVGIIALAQAVDQGTSDGQPPIDRLLHLAEQAPDPGAAPEVGELVEALLPGDIDRYLIFSRQLHALDLGIYRAAVRRSTAGAAATTGQGLVASRTEGQQFSLFSLAPTITPRQPAESEGEGHEQSLATALAIYARRHTPERNSRTDYEAYCAARESIESARLCSEEELLLEIAGQHLALASVDYFDAIRYRSVCDRRLAAALETGTLSERLHADAMLTMCITEVCAVDFVPGFSSLRTAVESRRATAASPELFTEAVGLMALVIVFFGEHRAYPEVLRLAQARIAEQGGAGASRAPTHLAELFLVAGDPGADPAALEAARELAERHGRDTVYRSFYHYIMMLSSYVTKDIERGLHHYSRIKLEGLWARFNRRFDRLSRLAYAIHLAAQGEFAAARRELGLQTASYESLSDGADFLIHKLFQLRLDLAVGRHQSVLAETMPEGPLGELRIQNVHLRRYAPVSLVLRGTALLREGERALALDCFARATQQSAMAEEWLALLAAETLEYRAWLETLDPDDPESLPGGLTPELLRAILGRPVLVRHTLEALTPQQTRILRMLAQGRSAASIAAELHISNNTLKTHLRQLYQRLGVRSRDQAVLHAERYGIL